MPCRVSPHQSATGAGAGCNGVAARGSICLDWTSLIAHAAGMLAALLFSAFFSGSETALFSLSPETVADYRKSDLTGAALAARLLGHPRRLLATILLGNMLVNVGFYSLSTSLAVKAGQRYGASAGVALSVGSLLCVIVFGEVLPKNVAVVVPERLSTLVSLPLFAIQLALSPVSAALVRVSDAVHRIVDRTIPRPPLCTPDEMRILLDMSQKAGALDPDAAEMIAEVLDLSDARVKQIMIPRVDMRCVEVRKGTSFALHVMRAEKRSYVAVYEDRVDNVLGLVRLRDAYFRAEEPLRTLVRKLPFLPETARLEAALREMRTKTAESAFVVDEYGALVGHVSIEQVVEEIVGEINDEYDRPEQLVRQIGPGRYMVSGDVSIRDWKDLFPVSLPDLPVDTVGGFVTASLGRVPRVGDRVSSAGLQFEVREVGRFRVRWLAVTLLAAAQPGQTGGGTAP